MEMKTQIAIIAKIAVSYRPWVSFGNSSSYVALLNVGNSRGSVSGPFHFSQYTLSPMGMLLPSDMASFPPTCWELVNLSPGETSL